MKIGIDARCFAGGKNTGVEEYTKNFLQALFTKTATDGSGHTFVLFFNAYKDIAVDFSWALEHKHVTLKSFHYPNKVLNALLWYARAPKIDKLLGGVDLFFMPNPNFCALSKDVPLVFTMHDLSYEHYKETFSLKRKIWHWAVNPRLLCERAVRIIAVSDATKHDIQSSYHINPSKITTLHNACTAITGTFTRNSLQILATQKKYDLPYKFILYFGTLEPRKNIVSIVTAYDDLRAKDQHTKHKLVLAGARGWHAAHIMRAIQASPHSADIMVISDIPSQEREFLYVLADVFVYPSFFEGFGFPPLEALKVGVPVITSNTSSLPEVVGDRAVMIDPTRPEELSAAIRDVISSKLLRSDLTDPEKRAHHIRPFAWSRNVEQFTEELTRIARAHESSQQKKGVMQKV